MIILSIILILTLLILLERNAAQAALSKLEEDHFFSKACAEPGEEGEIVIRLLNHSRRFLPYIRFRDRLPAGIEPAQDSSVETDREGKQYFAGTTWMKPRQALEKRLRVRFEKRGRYLLSQLKVAGGDFLGLEEEERSFEALREMIVFPKELSPGQFQPVFGGLMGDVSVRRFLFDDPVLTIGFRDYTGREPLKMISWTQSARRGGLMVKNPDFTSEPSVTVLLNTEYDGEEKEELLERCFSAARSVCSLLEKNRTSYEFAMNAGMLGSLRIYCFIPRGLGSSHFEAVLESLGRASYSVNCGIRELVRRNMEDRGSGNGVILITPARNDACLDAVRLLEGEYGCRVTTIAGKELGV